VAQYRKLGQPQATGRGNLIAVDFPLKACQPAPTAPACQALWNDLNNPFFIGGTPGLTQSMGWV
jgi:hypothetical protein